MSMMEWLADHRRAALGSLAFGAAVLLFFPFQTTVTNAWTISAVNVDGHPINGCRIEQKWEWPAIGLSRSDVITTNASGIAYFPSRKARASLIERAVGTVTGFNFHGPPTVRSVTFFGCDQMNRSVQLAVFQSGDSVSYRHQVSTVWRDSSRFK